MNPGLLASIPLAFDPALALGDRAIRLETLGLAIAVLAGLLWAALIAGRTPAFEGWIGTPVHAGHERASGVPEAGADDEPWHLRRDDLLFIVLGAVPGAVVVGRAFAGLVHLDYYSAYPQAILDPALGSASLAGAVIGGTLTGIYVAALLDAPVGRWLHVVIRPVLLVLALVKVAAALGGGGQGAPTDLPWATAYTGPGPWGSVDPATPAHPAQLYEAAATLAVLLVVALLARFTGLRRADGRLYAVGIALWALARGFVAGTWRDAEVLGPLKAEQLVCIAVFGVLIAAAGIATARRRRSARSVPIGEE